MISSRKPGRKRELLKIHIVIAAKNFEKMPIYIYIFKFDVTTRFFWKYMKANCLRRAALLPASIHDPGNTR